MKKNKYDMRYARSRILAGHESRPIGPLAYDYRAFFRSGRIDRNYPDFRNLAEILGLSVNTVRGVLDGSAVKLDPILKMAGHCGVDILEVFDIDGRLVFDENGNLAGVKNPNDGPGVAGPGKAKSK